MGSRLKKLKAKLGRKQLSDGKTIEGRERLTDDCIPKIQKYYGNAIRNYTDSS